VAFYVMQHERDGIIKMGYCEDWRVFVRMREHGTSSGYYYLISFVPKADRKFETAMFRLHRKYRRSRNDSPKDFELFAPHKQLRRWFSSKTAKELGFIKVRGWTRRDETAKQWLIILAQFGFEEARYALQVEARLRSIVPRSARGGWVLWELISGRLSKQTLLDFGQGWESHGVAPSRVNGWPMHRCTYKGTEFLFPVFAEACMRMGIKPPPGAIETGIRPQSHRVESGRKGIPLKKKTASRPVDRRNENQIELFGDIA
jgi:hypothetical protein